MEYQRCFLYYYWNISASIALILEYHRAVALKFSLLLC